MQFILIATTYGFVQSHSVGAHEEVLTIREVSIVDVVYNRLEPHRDVMIAGRHIVDVRTTGPLPEGRMLDGAGKHLMPGLWDFHVHVFTAPGEEDLALPVYTLNEISGIRDVGGFRGFKDMRAVAAATERGERVGPRIVLAGAVVDGPPGAWPGQMVARDAEDAKARVREAEAVGWTFIKSYSQLGEAAYLALAAEAARLARPLHGHIPESVRLETAIKAGHRSIDGGDGRAQQDHALNMGR